MPDKNKLDTLRARIKEEQDAFIKQAEHIN